MRGFLFYMTTEQKKYIEENINLMDGRKWELFFSDICPEGMGSILYDAEIEFLKDMTYVPARAFKYSDIQKIEIPNSIMSIDFDAFYTCTELTQVTIPESVVSIGKYAFYNCRGLTSITIPESVTSIGSYAFDYCRGLTSITIGSSVTSIGYRAFQDCTRLTSITFAEGSKLESIGDGAFQYCYSLTSIEIPESVTSIGADAFYNCESLTSINFGGTKTQWENATKYNSWNDNTSTITVYCTDGEIL